MYYHIRIDKIQHDGIVDEAAQAEWDFRSLHQGLIFLKRDFGADALGWRIEDLTDRSAELLMQERPLAEALESSHQYLIMTLRNDSAFAERYDHFRFFVVMRDDLEIQPKYTFSMSEESLITAPTTIFQPDFRQSMVDILRSFDMTITADIDSVAFDSIYEYYVDEEDVPGDIRDLKSKRPLSAADYCTLGDECQSCGEEQLAAVLYAKAVTADGDEEEKGKSFANLADLYMNSDWPKNGGREWDVMKAVDLLVEALSRGYKGAVEVAEGMREQLFEDYLDDVDVDDLIKNYQVDALCFAGFCLGVGLGWKKDTAKAAKLYESAFEQGYERASHYLNEIRTGRV